MLNYASPVNASYASASSAGALPNPVAGAGGGSLPAVFWMQPYGGTTISPQLGGALGATGTVSTTIAAAGADFTRFRRTRITGAAGAGSSGSIYVSYGRWFRGANGGFEGQLVFGVGSNATGYGAFAGFSTLLTGMTTADVSTLTDCVGVGFSAGDANTGVWKLVHNDASGAATITDIPGMTRSSTAGYVLRVSCPKGASSNITVSINDVVTGAVILTPTVLSSNLPTTNTTLSIGVHSYNGAIAASTIVDAASMYVTCDY